MSLTEKIAGAVNPQIGKYYHRLRLAVTADEWTLLQAEAFDRNQDFYERIRGIELIIVDEPDNEMIRIHVRPNSWGKE